MSGLAAVEASGGEGGPGEEAEPGVEATISVTGKHRIPALDGATVNVLFTQQVRKQVLSVPLTALIAIGGERFAVYVRGGGARRRIVVTPGLAADGYVEVEGEGPARRDDGGDGRMSEPPVLELRDVRKTYPGGVEALRGVSLSVGRGELTAIVGPSGSGKSTLLHLMGTLDRPSGGSVAIEGRDLSGPRDDELAGLRATRIGFVFQQLLPARGGAGDRQRRRRPALRRRPRRRAAPRAPPRRWPGSASPTASATAPPSSPAASASGSRWRGRWSASRRSSSPTSRPATSTAGPAAS